MVNLASIWIIVIFTVIAVTLVLGLAGAMALWSAVMELMRQSGLADSLSRLLRPLLRRLFTLRQEPPDQVDQQIHLNQKDLDRGRHENAGQEHDTLCPCQLFPPAQQRRQTDCCEHR